MRFYISSLFVAIILFLFVSVLVVIGLLIGYGWHFGSELYAMLTLQPGSGQSMLNDTVKTVTITALLLPYLAAGYIAARIAQGAEYLNVLVAALALVGPLVYFYPPLSLWQWLAYGGCVAVMLLGAIAAHLTRLREAKRLAKARQD